MTRNRASRSRASGGRRVSREDVVLGLLFAFSIGSGVAAILLGWWA